jgi:antitoxin component HigA of HigAB toxin-antitoxin module
MIDQEVRMNNWYDDLLVEEKPPESTNWYDQLLEGKPQESSTTGWYDEMLAKPETVEERPELGWGETAKEMLKSSPAVETAAHLGYGMASWVPSKISGLGQIGLQKITNKILEDATKDERRSLEEKEILRQKGFYSPEKIREMAEQSEALWQILPPPESKEAKYVLEKVGKGLDLALTPFRIADEYYTEKGYPNLGYALRFVGELLFFKAAHGLGVKSTAKLKKLRKKVAKEVPATEIKESLDAVLDEMKIEKEGITPKADTLKGVTKSQKMRAHKIAKEKGFTDTERGDLAERVTGKRSMMDMNRKSAREFIDALKRGKEEIKDAGRIREEAREAGEEVRIEREEERPLRIRDTEKDRLEAREREAKEEIVEPEVVETQTDIYHRNVSVPAVREALEAGNVSEARVIYNQTRLEKSELWRDKIKSEIDQFEAKGLEPSDVSIEQAKSELREAVRREREKPGTITENDIRVIAGRIGDNRILEALDLKTPEERLRRLDELVKEPLKALPEVEKVVLFEDLSDSAKGAIASDAMGKGQKPEEFISSEWIRKTVDIESLRDKNALVWGDKFIYRKSETEGPLVVSEKGEILDGNNRLREAIERNDKQVDILERRLFEEPPKEPPLRSDLSEKVRYEGIQETAFKSPTGEIETKPTHHTYTDLKTESTFIIPLEADLNKAVAAKLVEMDKAREAAEVKPRPPTHGTDIDALEGILEEGLRPGTAMDFSVKREWSGESPIQVEVPKAIKGEYVAHNKYYKLRGGARATKVIVDLDAYTDIGAEKVLKTVETLKKKYPKIEWSIEGVEPKVKVGALTEENMINLVKKRYGMDIKEAKETISMDLEDLKMYKLGEPYGYKKKIKNIKEYEEYLEWLERKPGKSAKEVKPEPPSEAVKTLISDDIRTAEDMGLYADIKEMIGKKKKVGEIMKELKQKAYYEEDLKDFGYTEKDIRESIRAIKAETGDKTAIKQIQSMLKVEEKKVEKIVEAKKIEPEKERPPEAKEEPITAPKEIDEVRARWEQEQVPLKNEEGRILKSKVFAMKRMKELGQTGELVKNPKGEGWLLKRERPSAEERLAEEKEWEEVLREEELGEIGEEGLGERVDVDIDHLWGEKGAITFDFESIRKLKDLIKKGLYSREEIIAGLKSRGAADKDINKLFSAVSVRIPIGESKWLKKGQSPLEFLPSRTVGKTKEGRVLKAPAVTREDAHIVATTTDLPSDVGAGLKKAPIGEKLRWAPSEGIFTQLGKPLREVFYRRMIKAHKKSSDYAKELLKEDRKLNETFSLGSRELHSERLNIYEVAQQPDGRARLKLQGVTKIPKLTSKEKIVYEARQEAYKKLYVEINKARIATGKRSFPPIENYTMWAHDMSKLKDFERISAFDKMEKIQAGLDRIRDIPSQIDKLGRTVSLKGHEKLRAGPDMPGYLILDSAENYKVYAKLAADVIHESEPIAYMHELLTGKFELSKNAPNTHKFLSQWLDFQKGHEPIMFIENAKARRLMRTFSSNVAVAYLTYQIRPAIVQLASLSLSYAKLGERFMGEGTVRLLSPFEIKRAARESNILTTRTPEEILIEAQRVYPFFKSLKGKTVAKGWAKTKRVGSRGLLFTDSIVSYLTWLGAEAKGKALYKKLSKDQQQAILIKDFSKNYADDITVQCQGSAAKAARAPLQRHAEGKLMTTLGTFTIANFDFITRHLMGIRNPDITKPQAVASAMRFVLASTIISSIFSEVLQLTSPIPTPVDAFRESLETDPDLKKAFQAAVTELLEFIPIYGGKYKFDSELMGPVVDQLVKLGKGDYSSLGRLGGMPGYQTLWKAYRAERQGGTAIDIVMGRYLEPRKSLTAPIGGRKSTDLLAPIGED